MEHGTLSMYQLGGCRCPLCSETRSIYDRQRRGRRPRTPTNFSATCWCERKAVSVSPDDVRRGMTASCGHAECHPTALTGAHLGG